MSGRVRELLDRPIDPEGRRRTFALAVGVLLLVAVALQLTDRPQPQFTPTATLTPLASAPNGTPRPSSRLGSLGGLQETAQRFLAGYLRYLYGHGPARRIQAADRRLVRRLGRVRPRVSPATRRRRPRVIELRVRRVGTGAVARAVIDHGGVARYPIELALIARSGRWVVRDLGVD